VPIEEYVTIERLDNQTIADSEAEVSESENYALWVDDKTDQRGSDIHFQRIKGEFIPWKDEEVIRTVYDQVLGDELFIGNDGHAKIEVKRWRNPDGEVVGAEELIDHLLQVL
jgi:hypothetical protein